MTKSNGPPTTVKWLLLLILAGLLAVVPGPIPPAHAEPSTPAAPDTVISYVDAATATTSTRDARRGLLRRYDDSRNVPRAHARESGPRLATKAPRTVTMGRDVSGRVIPYAERHGYDYYRGTPRAIPFRFQRLDLWFNKRWINKEMRRGSEIVDIGEPRGMPSSPFYEMERRATSGYSKYRQDPQP